MTLDCKGEKSCKNWKLNAVVCSRFIWRVNWINFLEEKSKVNDFACQLRGRACQKQCVIRLNGQDWKGERV